MTRRVLADVDWDRLEAEFADIDADLGARSSLANRVLAVVRRRHARRAVVAVMAAAMLASAFAVAVLALVLPPDRAPARPGPDRRATAVIGADTVARAQIYAAALSDGAGTVRPVRRIWVSSRTCWAIPASPITPSCADGRIPPAAQRLVIALVGPRVRFAAMPPVPHRRADAPVVQFGRLVMQGGRAELGMEMRCGLLCAEGQTLLLYDRNGQWRVSGSVGPRWVS